MNFLERENDSFEKVLNDWENYRLQMLDCGEKDCYLEDMFNRVGILAGGLAETKAQLEACQKELEVAKKVVEAAKSIEKYASHKKTSEEKLSFLRWCARRNQGIRSCDDAVWDTVADIYEALQALEESK